MAYLRKGTAFPSTITSGTLGAGITFPTGSIVQHIKGSETGAFSLSSGNSDDFETGNITPRSFNTTNGYFIFRTGGSFFKNTTDSSAGGQGTISVSYNGGGYSAISEDDQWLLKGSDTDEIISGYMSRSTPLQGSEVHQFKFTITSITSSFYVYANTMHWEVIEIFNP